MKGNERLRRDPRLAPLLGAALAVLTTGSLVAVSLIGVSGANRSGDPLEAYAGDTRNSAPMILPGTRTKDVSDAPAAPAEEEDTTSTEVDTFAEGAVAAVAAELATSTLAAAETGGDGAAQLARETADADDTTARLSLREGGGRALADTEGAGERRIAARGEGQESPEHNADDERRSHGKKQSHGKNKGHGKKQAHGRKKGHRHSRGASPANSPGQPHGGSGSSGTSGGSGSHANPSTGGRGNDDAPGHSGSPRNSGKAKGKKR